MPTSLSDYHAKRDFSRTPEPRADGAAGGARFVVQKHWARRLHYDFRLELDGTLKSWAVPKGPSVDPHDKRMAVQVEDHPLAYADFEGSIPAGQYGAGQVLIWDSGTWQAEGDARAGLARGELKFTLHGAKLQGRWVLVRMKDGKNWLLIKEKQDQHSIALPEHMAPALATLVEAPPRDAAAWIFEIKFDGYRLLTRVVAGQARLFTRNGHDWSAKLPALQRAMAGLPNGWYDGEIVVLDAQGHPSFDLLQQAIEAKGEVVYYLFDLPFGDGVDLRGQAADVRRAALQAAFTPTEMLRFSEEISAPPGQILEAACQMGLEGVIGKLRSAPYLERRSAQWIKLKCGLRQEFVVGGFTEPQGARTGVGALVLGLFDGGRLRHVGNVGSGIDEANLRGLRAKLTAKKTTVCPFAPAPKLKATWVRPELVAEVSFSAWTAGGSLRHPVFRGLRLDLPAASVQAREAPMKLTHGERVVDPHSGATKLDVVNYVDAAGELMMAYLAERPVALLRAPDGVAGQQFFQKHADVAKMPGLKTLALDDPPLLAVASVQGLLSAAQWNVLELHAQNARAKTYATPDRLVFDLDPGEGLPWRAMQEAAEVVHGLLEELGLQGFLKTSGGEGLHIYVPLRSRLGWDAAKECAHAIVLHLADTLPDRFVAKSGPRNRVGKIFVDYLRNGRGATTVTPWSLRARAGLGVSVPVAWDELGMLTGGDHWTIRSVFSRFELGNAPWADFAAAGRSLAKARKALGLA